LLTVVGRPTLEGMSRLLYYLRLCDCGDRHYWRWTSILIT